MASCGAGSGNAREEIGDVGAGDQENQGTTAMSIFRGSETVADAGEAIGMGAARVWRVELALCV